MSNWKSLSFALSTVLVATAIGTTPAAQSGRGPAAIQGVVTSADGAPMEGVLVSARAADRSFTTSVFTDRQGAYLFPSLDAGQYKVWAQAVGFEAGRAEFALAGARADRSFTLAPITDIGRIVKQMSGVEYLQSLPQRTPADRRMVHVFKNNCTGCHTASYPLQNRWDARGWGVLVDLMTVFPSTGEPVPAMRPTEKDPGNRMIAAYRDELAEYLGRARGATELGDLKLLPRPTGEATQVVITEFDLPRTDLPLHFDNGSDWSMGTPSRFIGRAAHDAWPDAEGNVWMADDEVPQRTFAKLDPRTGKVTDYALKGSNGKTIPTHRIVVDHLGKVWAAGRDGNFSMLNPRTGEMKNFPRPAGMKAAVGGTLDVDSKGNPSATSTNGAITLDAASGRYTYYEGPPAREGFCGAECGGWGTYGITVDKDDNAWVTNPGLDRLLKVDSRTGKVTALEFELLSLPEATDLDRQRMRTVRGGQNSAPPGQKAPRRLAADPNNNLVWVALYTSDRIARVDTRTNQVKEYPIPTPYASPYAIGVDKNGVVWINTMSHDALTKFDPRTERFTEYRLPTRGTEIRHVQIDNRTDPVTVWAPYNRTNKVVRLQFRATPSRQTRASR
ncbi:MAG: carboxypeptidase regulatory-like domain-containing protein [Acidobacteria bacterium]|nr:carboxypeptidase regulatory-like domain-containing protein [Acidobacteriota bacterium]